MSTYGKGIVRVYIPATKNGATKTAVLLLYRGAISSDGESVQFCLGDKGSRPLSHHGEGVPYDRH